MNLSNHEAEGMVLSAMMIDKACVERVAPMLSTDDFDREIHRAIFSEIVDLHKSGAESDEKAISTRFRSRGQDVRIELAEISGMSASSANVDYYIGIIKDLSIRRSATRIAKEGIERLASQDEKGAEVSGEIERRISEVNLGSCGNEYKHVSRYLGDVCDELDWAVETMGQIRGIDAPFKSLDEITGFRNGEYIIIAARPSLGKTAMALNMVEEIAIRRKVPTGMFSLEMSAKQLNFRMVCTLCGFNTYGVQCGLYRSPKDKEKLARALQSIAESPLYIDETGGIRLSELKTKARRMVKIDGCKIIFIDYIGLINAELPKLARHEQIAEVSRTIALLKKELNVPFVVLSQLVRDTENKRPGLSALAETRALEQDADVIAFIHRQRIEDMTQDERSQFENAIPTELIVAKNRNGPTGVANLVFKPRLTKFEDLTNSGNGVE